MKPSTSTASCASFRSARISGDCNKVRSLLKAATNASGSSARITPRLPDNATGLTTAGYRIERATVPRIRSDRRRDEPGHRKACGLEPLARALLVPGDRRCLGRVPRHSEGVGGARPDHRRPVADDQDAIERAGAGGREDLGDGGRLVMEPDGNRLVAPRIFDHVAPIGGEHQVNAQPLGRLTKRTRLVSRRRGQNEDATHDSGFKGSSRVQGFGSKILEPRTLNSP